MPGPRKGASSTGRQAAGRCGRWTVRSGSPAGALVVLGLIVDLFVPGVRWASAAVGGGLIFSALTSTCGMAALLAKLPHNRRANAAFDLNATLKALRG